ncbi:uncharacterized protein LOC117134698 [Drosophila busckii]|uniref:uncharacterized protein LOC117134698 n=1 Tax=Drosophila busckii TaxID=30019 RepID=UPI001432BF21|nr:uncharacterized protein LOC117134698 [Drosophila busckii]
MLLELSPTTARPKPYSKLDERSAKSSGGSEARRGVDTPATTTKQSKRCRARQESSSTAARPKSKSGVNECSPRRHSGGEARRRTETPVIVANTARDWLCHRGCKRKTTRQGRGSAEGAKTSDKAGHG